MSLRIWQWQDFSFLLGWDQTQGLHVRSMCSTAESNAWSTTTRVYEKRVRDTVQRTGYKHTLHARGPDPIPWHSRAPLNLASCVPKQTYINHEMMVFDCSGVQVMFPGEFTRRHPWFLELAQSVFKTLTLALLCVFIKLHLSMCHWWYTLVSTTPGSSPVLIRSGRWYVWGMPHEENKAVNFPWEMGIPPRSIQFYMTGHAVTPSTDVPLRKRKHAGNVITICHPWQSTSSIRDQRFDRKESVPPNWWEWELAEGTEWMIYTFIIQN